jgi:Bor protein
MKSNRILVTVAVAAFAITGCFKHSFTVGNGGGDTSRPPTSTQSKAHYFFGLIGEDNIDVKSVCPSGNATIKDQHTFVDGLIGAIIGIIYHPTTVEIWCEESGGGGSTQSLVIPAETLRKIAQDPRTLEYLKSVSDERADELAAALQSYGAPSMVSSAQ